MGVICPRCNAPLVKVEGENYLYKCSVCGSAFFVCPQCGRLFEKMHALAGHLRVCKRRTYLKELARELGLDGGEEFEEVVAYALLKLIRMVTEIRESLNLMRESKVREVLTVEPVQVGEVGEIEEELPSFARDNPWLSVLAKRGKE